MSGRGAAFRPGCTPRAALREIGGIAHPDFELADWLRFAKRLMDVGPGGASSFDYDMKIAEPFNAPQRRAVDLWPAFRALAGRPVWRSGASCRTSLRARRSSEMAVAMPEMDVCMVRAPAIAPDARGARGAGGDRAAARSRTGRMTSRPRILHLHSTFDAGGRSCAACG
jgi:hypothetical protein